MSPEGDAGAADDAAFKRRKSIPFRAAAADTVSDETLGTNSMRAGLLLVVALERVAPLGVFLAERCGQRQTYHPDWIGVCLNNSFHPVTAAVLFAMKGVLKPRAAAAFQPLLWPIQRLSLAGDTTTIASRPRRAVCWLLRKPEGLC